MAREAKNGGERGIRTLGTLARTTVFETAPFNHSGTSPKVAGSSDCGCAFQAWKSHDLAMTPVSRLSLARETSGLCAFAILPQPVRDKSYG